VGKTRFWKKSPVKKMAGIPQSDSSILVSGRVSEVLYTKNGIPYYGGPRYCLVWENGDFDREISLNELLNIYKETAHSLGGGSLFNEEINLGLKQVAYELGDLLESRKADLFIFELKNKLKSSQLNVVGMMEIALQSIANVLTSVKDISLMACKQETIEMKSLIHYSMEVQSVKYAKPYQYNAYQIVQDVLDQETVITTTTTNTMTSHHHHHTIDIDSMSSIKEYYKEDVYSTVWLCTEIAVPPGFVWSRATHYDRYFIVLQKSKEYTSLQITPYDRKCFFGVLSSIELAIQTLWNTDQQKKHYKEFLKNIENKFFEWRSQSYLEICSNTLLEVQTHILDGDMYLGFIESGAKSLQYVVSSPRSFMENKRLLRNEGISFDVIESKKRFLVEKNQLNKKKMLSIGAKVDVLYGKTWYVGEIVKYHGHEKYDIRYDIDHRIEAGIDIRRITPHDRIFKMKFFGKVNFPMIMIPIRNRNKCFGIFTIDSIQTIITATTTSHMIVESSQCQHSFENIQLTHDLQVCLEQVGKLLGSALDMKSKKFALESLYIVSKNQYARLSDLIVSLMDAIFQSSCFVIGAVFAEVRMEQAKKAMSTPTTTTTTSSAPGGGGGGGLTRLLGSLKASSSSSSSTTATNNHSTTTSKLVSSTVNILQQRGEIPIEFLKKLQTFDRSKFGRKTVQKVGKSIWLLCDIPSMNEKNVIYCYVTLIVFHDIIEDADSEFLEILQKALMTLIQSIITSKSSNQIRQETLLLVKEYCAFILTQQQRQAYHWYSIPPTKGLLPLPSLPSPSSLPSSSLPLTKQSQRQYIFHHISEHISHCFAGANIYVGLLGKHTTKISYILASIKSNMLGQQLIRQENKRGISFLAIDEQHSLCILSNSPYASSLQHFGFKQNFEFPLIITPMIVGLDGMIGILASDGCGGGMQANVEHEEQLSDIVLFFEQIANQLAPMIQSYRQEDISNHLKEIAYTKSS
jgi:hypothetical protein